MRLPLIAAAMNSSREGVYIPPAVIPVAPRRGHRDVGPSTRPEPLDLNRFKNRLDGATMRPHILNMFRTRARSRGGGCDDPDPAGDGAVRRDRGGPDDLARAPAVAPRPGVPPQRVRGPRGSGGRGHPAAR